MDNRRRFLRKTAAVGTAFLAAASKGTRARRRSSQEEAPGRRRRIIFNDDGGPLWQAAYDWPGSPTLASVDDFLRQRMKGKLEQTQVDSIFYNGHTRYPNWKFPTQHIRALGDDPLRHVVRFAHGIGREFVYSIRMNEIHCAVLPGAARWSPFKRQNLDLLQGRITSDEFQQRILPWARGETSIHPLEEGLRHLFGGGRDFYSWAAYDYARSRVRDYFLGIVEGACRRYDLDGVELDWSRFPYLFKFGEERRNIPIMTDFIGQIHQLLGRYGEKRGRPILLAMRVPDTPELALSIGLDVEAWLRQGWLDVLVAGFGFTPFTYPLKEWIRLGHRHHATVYGSMDYLVPVLEKREAIRAAAARFWAEGSDGIYIYNAHGIPTTTIRPGVEIYEALDEVGDPARLSRLDKLYQVDPDAYASVLREFSGRWHGWGGFHVGSWPGQLPRAFATRSAPARARFRLRIADRPETASKVKILTRWSPAPASDQVSWEINDQGSPSPRAATGVEGTGWSEFETKALREGMNTLQVTVRGTPAGVNQPLLEEVRVSLKYQQDMGCIGSDTRLSHQDEGGVTRRELQHKNGGEGRG